MPSPPSGVFVQTWSGPLSGGTAADRYAETDGGKRLATNAALAAILIAGCLLRLYKLTAFSLWFDESVSFALSNLPLTQLITHVARDSHPPLYFVVLKIWRGCFGDSLFALRSLSLVFQVAAVWFVYRFVKAAFDDRRFALIAALLVAVNPFQIQYARETRMYAMGVCLVLATSLLLVRAIRSKWRRDWIWYGIACGACLYTHYYLIFAIAAHALVIAGLCASAPAPRAARLIRSSVLAFGIAAALFAPWLPTFVSQVRSVREDFWIPPATLERLLRVPWALVLGGSDSEWTPMLWVTMLAVALGVLLVVAIRRAHGWPAWLVIAQATLPIAASLALSMVRPIFVDRYFLFASAFWSILIAGILARIRGRSLRRAAVACVVLFSVAMLLKNLNAIYLVSIRHPVSRPGVAGAAAFVNSHATPRDAIVVAHSLIYFSFKYYNRTNIRPVLYSIVPFDRFANYAGAPALDPRDLTSNLGVIDGPQRVWFLWTDGFYQKKTPVPVGWRLETTQRFEDTPGYKGSIYVDKYVVPGGSR